MVVATVLSALMVTGCSSSTPDVSPSPSPSPSVTAEGPWKDAAWAVPVVSTGTRLGEVSDKRIRIIVYQVATAKAPTDSEMVDVSDGQPLIAKGDPIVLLRYVVTNISKDPINLGIGTVSLTTSYPDWSWNQGLVGVRAPELMARHKLFTTPFKDGTARPPYVLGPGESFMIGQNVAYEKAELLQITAAVVVSDNSGSEDASLSWTLKGSVHLL
ncbi:hypothetical protein [Acidipropionibacterium thoenii]|uniref:hypothetical protein n=1 Tax=Acidipropionibacterium thoenii TaxID=1751 RepID=UPI0004869D66|nr:hypothetical protein [Acidipropionibacterium thoenii]